VLRAPWPVLPPPPADQARPLAPGTRRFLGLLRLLQQLADPGTQRGAWRYTVVANIALLFMMPPPQVGCRAGQLGGLARRRCASAFPAAEPLGSLLSGVAIS
jgi:hypothetical protein